MSVQKRIRMCLLLNKMDVHQEYSKRLGLENKSVFHGTPVDDVLEKKRGNGK